MVNNYNTGRAIHPAAYVSTVVVEARPEWKPKPEVALHFFTKLADDPECAPNVLSASFRRREDVDEIVDALRKHADKVFGPRGEKSA